MYKQIDMEEGEKRESKIANAIGDFLIIICIPFLIVFLTIAIKSMVNHDHLPDFMGYKPLICVSNSMEDVFRVGDITISKQVEESKLKEGDIITFWDTNRNIVITHRLDKIDKDENNNTIYITKGDMNNEADQEIVEFQDIEGKYIGKIKYLGYLILFLQQPMGLFMIFLLPLLIIVLIDKQDARKNKIRDNRREKLLKKILDKQIH